MRQNSPQKILFEMLSSFAVLARTLNLSKAVGELNTTRQTVRRHINLLEKHRGEKLFELKDRQYHLTEAGKRSLPEAEILLAKGDAWLSGQLAHEKGLQSVTINEKGLPPFYSQQHRLNRLWQDGTALLQLGFKSWVCAGASVESGAFSAIRPYWIVFRRLGDQWLCVELGEKSALATWFGWTWTTSSVSSSLEDIPAGANHADRILNDYDDVFTSGGARLDHQHRHVSRVKDGPLLPISFQRLLLACTFPDGEFALVILADRTYQLDIPGLTQSQIEMMSDDMLMEFDPAKTDAVEP